MKRRLLIFTAIVLLLPILLLGWLTGTEAGLRWTYRTAAPWLPEEFSAADISGRLAGPIRLTRPAWRQQHLDVEAATLEVDWNPWALFTLQLEITRLNATSLKIGLAAEKAIQEPSPAPELPGIVLPFALQLDNALVDGIEIRRGESVYRLARVELRGDAWHNRFEIGNLAVASDDFSLRIDGKITTGDDYPHELGFDWQASLLSGDSFAGSGRIAGDLSATRLEQHVEGKLAFEQWLELRDPLAALHWKAGIVAEHFDSRSLDPGLPPIEGRLQATAEGDLESLQASGKVVASAPRIGDFVADFELHSLDGERRFDGLHLDQLAVTALGGEIRSRGVVEWLPVPRWQLEVAAASIDPSALFADWPGQLNADFDTSGSFDNPKLQAHIEIARLQGRLRDYPVTARGKLDWVDGGLGIDGLEISSGGTRIDASGKAAETLDLKWRLASSDLGELYPGASGHLDAEGSLGGSRDAPRIEAKFDGRALGYDEYRLGSVNGRVSLNPLQADRYEIRATAHELSIRGRPLQSVSIVGDQRHIEARLAADEASVRVTLDGSFDGAQWRGKLVEADIVSRDYDTWKLLAPAALELSGKRVTLGNACLQSPRHSRICGSIEQLPERWKFALDIERLPLEMLARWAPPRLQAGGLADARAELDYQPAANRLQGDARLHLSKGQARITLDTDPPLQVDYRSAGLELHLRPDEIAATATLEFANGDSLRAGARVPNADLLAGDLAERPLQATLKGRITDLALAGRLNPQLESLHGVLELDLAISGLPAEPRIGGEARLRNASLQLARLDMPLEISELAIRGDDSRNLTYRGSARLGTGLVELDGNTRLDANAGWPSGIHLTGRTFTIQEILRPWLPEGITIDGQANADAELHFTAPSRLHGKIGLTSTRGVLHYPQLHEEADREYRDARLDLELDQDGIHGAARLTFNDADRLEASLTLPNAGLLTLEPGSQPLAATVRVEFAQAGILQTLLPDIDNPRGRLTLDANAAGTLASPKLTAQARLEDAAVDIPRLGLKIKPLRMTGSSDADGHFKFVVEARSGDGTLTIKGSSLLDAAQGWPTRIEINGENFVAARIPEASVDLSPALVVQIQGRSIDISGDLHVPFARLQPRDISTAQRVSSDTVIIGGDQPAETSWRITTHINLILGDRVAFYGYGFEGQLTGNLKIDQQAGQPTSGTGEIAIPSGRYRAYGQRLDIKDGRVLFTGGPVTNPGLDIRATRTSGTIVTGLLVRGRLSNPQIELFSTPAMGQTDILSYLLFGRPLETASGEDSALMAQAALTLGLAGGDQLARSLRERFGLDEFRVETTDSGNQASLVVGRYLSPDFYVSYAVGLVESVNALSLRYQINDRWQLEATSGVHQGADLLYTIER